MPYKLLSATPSPYARKVRVALLEKGVPFELVTEVPWDSTTTTPRYNPLEKLPVLISVSSSDDNETNGETVEESVYDSAMILEWIEAMHPSPPLLPPPQDVKKRLKAKQIETLCDGICDALVLYFFEQQREEGYASKPWMERQARKVNGGLDALAEMVDKDAQKGQGWLLGDNVGFSHADLCAAICVAYVRLRGPSFEVDKRWPVLKAFNERCEARESFKQTVPKAQSFQDKVV